MSHDTGFNVGVGEIVKSSWDNGIGKEGSVDGGGGGGNGCVGGGGGGGGCEEGGKNVPKVSNVVNREIDVSSSSSLLQIS